MVAQDLETTLQQIEATLSVDTSDEQVAGAEGEPRGSISAADKIKEHRRSRDFDLRQAPLVEAPRRPDAQPDARISLSQQTW